MQHYLDTVLRKQQIAIVLYHEGPVPWIMKVIAKSSALKERALNFGTFSNPPAEIQEQMPNIPQLVLVALNPGADPNDYTQDDLQIMPINSRMEYEPLMNWFLLVKFGGLC